MAGRSSAGVMTADEFVISEARSGLGKHGLLSCRHVLQAHRMGELCSLQRFSATIPS